MEPSSTFPSGPRPGEQADIKLSRLRPVSVGGQRLVFQHPHDPDALIKVARPNATVARPSWRQLLIGESMADRHGRRTLLECREFHELQARMPVAPDCIAPVLGVVATDLGLGLVVTKVRGRRGVLARNLAQIVAEDGVTESLNRQLRAFCAELESSGVIVSDLRPANIVQAWDESRGEHLVLVDGFGEKLRVPINRWSVLIRRSGCQRHLRRLMARIEGTGTSTHAPHTGEHTVFGLLPILLPPLLDGLVD